MSYNTYPYREYPPPSIQSICCLPIHLNNREVFTYIQSGYIGNKDWYYHIYPEINMNKQPSQYIYALETYFSSASPGSALYLFKLGEYILCADSYVSIANNAKYIFKNIDIVSNENKYYLAVSMRANIGVILEENTPLFEII